MYYLHLSIIVYYSYCDVYNLYHGYSRNSDSQCMCFSQGKCFRKMYPIECHKGYCLSPTISYAILDRMLAINNISFVSLKNT